MANQFLSLSLFLMLLSFFIVMNSISSFEKSKSVPILNSLSLAFTGQESPKPVAPSMEQTDDPHKSGKRDGDTLQEIEGLFKASISGFQLKRNRFGTVMHVRMPIGRFENALRFESYDVKNVETGQKGAFLPTLITLLRSAERGQQYRIDMVLNTDQDIGAEDYTQNEGFMATLRRVSDVAAIVEKKGLPKKLISAGLKKGENGMLDLYFRHYHPFSLPAERADRDE